MDAISRRELLRRIIRAAIVGPVVIATRDEQADVLYRLAMWFGQSSAVGRWLTGLWWRW